METSHDMNNQNLMGSEEDGEAMAFEENHEDSSDSDDSEKEREEHYALERKVVELRKQLSQSPYAYNIHVDIINCLKKLGELDQLRHAREAMHSIYPLTEEMWLDWLRDEMKMALTEEEKCKIPVLFERAAQDYLSIDIWVEYIQFSLSGLDVGGADILKKIREVMEKAIQHGGLHPVKGAILWDSYRDFEMALYQTSKQGSSEEIATQTRRITQLFNRQLSVPLLDMERTWNEYNDWLQTLDQQIEPHVKASYEKAKAQKEKLSPLEDTLLIAVENVDKATVYHTYLDLEINEFKNPARIQALYERIVAEMPLYDIFWIEYYKYVDQQFKTAETTFSVLNRATRNCPWNGSIWADYIFASERYHKEPSFISGLVEKALNAGLGSATDFVTVWLSFIEYLVRQCKWDDEEKVAQVREAFTRATDHISQNFDIEGDSECTLLQFWANIEAKKLNNLKRARELWGDIIRQGHNKSAQWWLAYIQFERTYGDDVTVVRNLFSKSLNAVPSNDWPEVIIKQWLQFERENGDLQSMDTARQKCEARLKKVTKEREEQGVSVPEVESSTKSRKRGKLDDGDKQIKPPIQAKKQKMDSGSSVPGKFGSNGSAESSKPVQPQISKPIVIPQPITDPSRHANTVFVSNLDFNVSEDEIRSVMGTSGTVTDIRLVRDYKQRSKGFCYVEYSSHEEARAALKRDREPLNGRPMFISPSEPDAAMKHPVFKYHTTLEKKKLFVKGLSRSTTKEQVEELFSQYGTVKDARLVTFKSGVPKGLAYVEFEDEVSASIALSKTDGMTFQEQVLTVALSNPPPRREKEMTEKDIMNLKAAPRTRRTQVSFIPNAVLRQTQSSTIPPPIGTAPKSNADFRSMLLKK